MESRFLHDLAESHKRHEGWYPGSLSWRNLNPGNLRLTAYQMRVYGAQKGTGGFARFPTYEAGFRALQDDLRAKITGHSAHINYAKNPTLLDYVKVYAPRGDGNDPNAYAYAIISDLPQYDLKLTTPLTELARLIEMPVFSESAARRRAERIAERSAEPKKSRILRRVRSQ